MKPERENSDREMLLLVVERLKNVQDNLNDLHKRFEEYVTQHEFKPVRLITYGFVALVMSSILAAVIASVLR